MLPVFQADNIMFITIIKIIHSALCINLRSGFVKENKRSQQYHIFKEMHASVLNMGIMMG